MSKQFILYQDDLGNYEIRYGDKVFHFLWEVAPILNEQQATIKQLESDKAIAEDYANIFEKENVKLRIENKKLQEENEQLRENLHNCRLNKNIISEKLKLWQDTLAEYDIYTIKDFKELMKNDN